jgi:thiosulfate dehydrogenase
MTRLAFLLTLSHIAFSVGCSDSPGSGASVSGEALYAEPHDDGNTFACATCHALEEPAADGIRRPGHAIGDAANRPSFKNGQLTDLLDAVNSCRMEWMVAPAFEQADPRWLALLEYLTESAGSSQAAPLTYDIVEPPADTDGGDETSGQTLFNASCVLCHGVDAVGTDRGPALRGSFLDAETIARKVRMSGVAWRFGRPTA